MWLEINPSWAEMPWKAFSHPGERFQVLPSFVLGEFAFICLAIITLVHALAHGRQHLTVWLAAFTAGTANDAIFMMLPMVDNFWQAQAVVMLTPRMPLYIPCVYNVFLYLSAVAGWRAGLSLLPTVALSGILGEMIYAPYDITGAKFLWWTWHDTDAPIRERLLGVPIGSTVWVITFSASFQFLVSYFLRKASSPLRLTIGLLLVSVLATPIMCLQMALLQLFSLESQGLPTYRSLLLVLTIYLFTINKGFAHRSPDRNLNTSLTNWVVVMFLEWYYLFLSVNMLGADPASHLSTGVHQEIGDCSVRAPDITGHERQVYLCAETHSQDFLLDCAQLCSQNVFDDCAVQTSTWYSVCGRPHTNYLLWVGVTITLCSLGAFTYAWLLRQRSRRKED